MIPLTLPSTPILDPATTNVFLLTGEPLTLVDTGFRTTEAWGALNSQLAEHGYKIKDLKQLVLTHAHPDHYGLAARIAATAAVEILSHKDAAPILSRKSDGHQKGLEFLFEALKKSGAPEAPLAKRLKPRKNGNPFAEHIEITRTVEDGEPITEGSEKWVVKDLPGHAPGLIGLFCYEKKELIVSDHLLPEINSRPGLYRLPGTLERDSRYMGEYIATLGRINRMDLNIVWPSHGDPITDVHEVTEKWIYKHNKRASMIAEPLADGDKTAYHIWKTHFPMILPFDPVKGLIEIITYLDLFVSEGKINTYQQEGLIYYHLL